MFIFVEIERLKWPVLHLRLRPAFVGQIFCIRSVYDAENENRVSPGRILTEFTVRGLRV